MTYSTNTQRNLRAFALRGCDSDFGSTAEGWWNWKLHVTAHRNPLYHFDSGPYFKCVTPNENRCLRQNQTISTICLLFKCLLLTPKKYSYTINCTAYLFSYTIVAGIGTIIENSVQHAHETPSDNFGFSCSFKLYSMVFCFIPWRFVNSNIF